MPLRQLKIEDNSLVFDESTSIAFERTIRIPDGDNEYPLPPSFGHFPVKLVDNYLDRVPESWKKTGGVFIPMFQREAMWISFKAHPEKSRAVKVAVGKVNAVSGKEWSQTLTSDEEDYMVIPSQPWLDGINAGDGFIKQFVAMPLGKGYTVEAQVTGKEEFGGIQIIVYFPKPRPPPVLQQTSPFSLSSPSPSFPSYAPTSSIQTPNAPTFKVVMVGDGGVGKTTFVKRHLTGEFDNKLYAPTLGCDAYDIRFYTNFGPVLFNCWDTSGEEKLSGSLRDGYYKGAHAAIVMFDVTSNGSFQHVSSWVKDVRRVCGNIPIVVVGNKRDQSRVVSLNAINTFTTENQLHYCDVSTKSCYKLDDPFLHIARKLTKTQELYFVETPALSPPEIVIDPIQLQKYESELMSACSAPLPDEDEFDDPLPPPTTTSTRSSTAVPQQVAREMGIAAGGKMKQKIYRDTHGVEHWDQEDYLRVFVHIVNSTMYEQITNEKPPETPIDAKTYSSFGYPWFNIYDEKVPSVPASSILKQVKSVKEMDLQKFSAPQQDDTAVSINPQQIITYNKVRDGEW